MNAFWTNMFIGFILCTIPSSIQWLHHNERTCSYGSYFALYLEASNECILNKHVHRVHTLYYTFKHSMIAPQWTNMFIWFILCTVPWSIKWMHPERTCSYGSYFALYLQASNDSIMQKMIALCRKWYITRITRLCVLFCVIQFLWQHCPLWIPIVNDASIWCLEVQWKVETCAGIKWMHPEQTSPLGS